MDASRAELRPDSMQRLLPAPVHGRRAHELRRCKRLEPRVYAAAESVEVAVEDAELRRALAGGFVRGVAEDTTG